MAWLVVWRGTLLYWVLGFFVGVLLTLGAVQIFPSIDLLIGVFVATPLAIRMMLRKQFSDFSLAVQSTPYLGDAVGSQTSHLENLRIAWLLYWRVGLVVLGLRVLLARLGFVELMGTTAFLVQAFLPAFFVWVPIVIAMMIEKRYRGFSLKVVRCVFR